MMIRPPARFVPILLALLPILSIHSRTAIASDEGMIAAEQVSQSNYIDLMDNYLFTHEGNNRGPTGPDLIPARDNIVSLMQSYGLDVTLEDFTYNDVVYQNVVGTKMGTVYPNAQYIIGAHYDSVSNPGADDNASGVALVLETARIVSQYESDYTIKFIAFSMEERGLIGSQAYVDAHIGDDIRGMISADMVAYNPGTNHAAIFGRTTSASIKNAVASALAEYGAGLTCTVGGDRPSSDHASFEADGYQACVLIEGFASDNPYYHKQTDSFENPDNLNFPFATKMTRTVVGWLVDQAVTDVPVPRIEVTLPLPLPMFVSPLHGEEVECIATGFFGVTPAPNTGTLHYDLGNGWRTIPMTETAYNHYRATLRGGNCGESIRFYFSVQALDGDVYTSPEDAPGFYYEAINAEGRHTAVDFPLNSNPGWTMEGQWGFGYPSGDGGTLHGAPDPVAGRTGLFVLGYNLYGDYSSFMPETHLTTDPIDCSGLHGLSLKFWRWLGVEDPMFDHAYVRIRVDGGPWETLWENDSEVADTDWVEMVFDISEIADDHSSVEIRWTMGETDSAWEYCGWNIDDISLTAYRCESNCIGELGDMDGNGTVDGQDIQLFVDALCGPYEPCADLAEQDGYLNEADVQAMLSRLVASD